MTESSSSKYYSSKFGLVYSDASILNTLDVHLPLNPATESADKDKKLIWIIFIHGGGWRDATQSSVDLVPALEYLPPKEYSIGGVASINYRLSPHPSQPAEPGSADERARTARHPTHIHDVLTALAWLQKEYHFGRNYVLSGHSAGATLAFQAVMGRWSLEDKANPEPPVGITGICGIYDLRSFVDTHPDQPLYRDVVVGAFGEDRGQWFHVSPVSANYLDSWPIAQAVVLAPSHDDELIAFEQAEKMSDHLWTQKSSSRRDVVIKLQGTHDKVVSEGKELARAVIKCLDMVSV